MTFTGVEIGKHEVQLPSHIQDHLTVWCVSGGFFVPEWWYATPCSKSDIPAFTHELTVIFYLYFTCSRIFISHITPGVQIFPAWLHTFAATVRTLFQSAISLMQDWAVLMGTYTINILEYIVLYPLLMSVNVFQITREFTFPPTCKTHTQEFVENILVVYIYKERPQSLSQIILMCKNDLFY